MEKPKFHWFYGFPPNNLRFMVRILKPFLDSDICPYEQVPDPKTMKIV
jgi:hypothetical protein